MRSRWREDGKLVNNGLGVDGEWIGSGWGVESAENVVLRIVSWIGTKLRECW